MRSKRNFLKVSIIIFLIFSGCKQLQDAVDPIAYQSPVIKSIALNPSTKINPLDTVQIIVVAVNTEDDLMTYSWSAEAGQFVPPVNKDTVYWVAPIEGGEYSITIKIENKRKSDSRDLQVTVQSPEKPLVNIIYPEEGEYFVLGSEIKVEVEAFHPNRLSYIKLFAADSLLDQESYNSSNNYFLNFITFQKMVGQLDLKVEAQVFNQPGNINIDSVNINIEGILPKSKKP